MKQTLIFLLFLFLAFSADVKPYDLKALQTQTIHVSMEGAVKQPGIVELPLYATVQDALDSVGLQEDADIRGLNPMTILKDRDSLVIPHMTDSQVIKVSINTGTKDMLISIPGIGEATAEKIIAYRQENGLFQELEDLMKVKGIGQAKFENMKDYIML